MTMLRLPDDGRRSGHHQARLVFCHGSAAPLCNTRHGFYCAHLIPSSSLRGLRLSLDNTPTAKSPKIAPLAPRDTVKLPGALR